MKPILKIIIMSFFFSAAGMFCFFKLRGDWILSWVGVLMAYLSLYTIINLYCKNTYATLFTKILIRTAGISFSFGVLGIAFGVIYQLLGTWSLGLMAEYWLLMLLVYIINLISLVILVVKYRNDKYYTKLCRCLILLSLFLTIGPVFYPLFLTFLGNGMNASAGW
ncbi:DUF3902 family protein [Bacillus cereus]|uniref:DUF3902 family protein n=1 Tax=Bacillus thuringiensis TaxID=1428 RepID=UPI00044C0315|nr:DUF3902 family protein [Bacillus thuringiensis]MDA2113485.1 DUF3902 family protein [Bacillus cereus]EXY04727.1 hypothetical protein BF15_07465 [Bacillus thuringiensis]MDA2130689.1 DUF3902 family protein [Bacillus cereus]MDA2153005.1 DUF3902 family protein [Bacillus cereus]MDA2526156.1 DUF3902 family protein [Bacillus cereus]